MWHLPAAELAVEPVGRVVAGVVLVPVTVMLLVHPLSVLLRIVLGTLAVDEVLALRLGELVDLGSGETSEELLGEGVLDGLACSILEMDDRSRKAVVTYPACVGGPRRP